MKWSFLAAFFCGAASVISANVVLGLNVQGWNYVTDGLVFGLIGGGVIGLLKSTNSFKVKWCAGLALVFLIVYMIWLFVLSRM